MFRVGIVGGGIGGLTAAIALRSRGFDVRVFERSPASGAEGVALLMWANAVRALTRLGIDLEACSAPIVHTEIRTSEGALLCSLPINDWSANAGARSVAIRRPVLVKALADAVPADLVETGCAAKSFARTSSGVRLETADGRHHDFDVLVGADGLHSVIHAQLHGDHPIRTMNQRVWVGLSRPRAGLLRSGVTVATIGRGPRFWVAPLPNDEAFWFATLNRAEMPDGDPLPFLRRQLEGWPALVDDILDATRSEDIVHARSCDRLPAERWGEGPVTLLGDAAHASTPDLGQGACQAIESAVVLADCLGAHDEPTAGLRAYERARMDHTATVSRMSWITSFQTTIESPMLCAMRDAGIRVALPAIAQRNFAWLVGTAG